MKSPSLVAASLVALASAGQERHRFRTTTVTMTETTTVVPAGCTSAPAAYTSTAEPPRPTMNNPAANPRPPTLPDFDQVVTINFVRLNGDIEEFDINVGTAANDLALFFGGDDSFVGASIAAISEGDNAPEDIECEAQVGSASNFMAFDIDTPAVFAEGQARSIPQVRCGLKSV